MTVDDERPQSGTRYVDHLEFPALPIRPAAVGGFDCLLPCRQALGVYSDSSELTPPELGGTLQPLDWFEQHIARGSGWRACHSEDGDDCAKYEPAFHRPNLPAHNGTYAPPVDRTYCRLWTAWFALGFLDAVECGKIVMEHLDAPSATKSRPERVLSAS